ncbi:uncharacterized protein OCT59_014559 [Rhizophagus irregularis]|uniref:uncharacterized protein n=1 Tax=Rhizophagus irregularis TaxID=588596 RepID=UPI001C14B6E2|nr:hypothetical protein OCT59_014559 [Rhizophagus irregularis]CAB5209320.1 unnamed protein product [Rhizophagus irregularis]
MLGCFVVGEDNTFTIKTDSIENISQLKEAARRTCLKLLMQTNLYYGKAFWHKPHCKHIHIIVQIPPATTGKKMGFG